MSKIKGYAYDKEESEMVSEWVASALNGGDYDRGAVEEAAETANRVREAFGRLCEVLADAQVLDASDVHYIAKGYRDSDVQIIL
jgi:hypothetical protein